ncbi:nucleotidyltransferase family protein [Sphingobacterium endophyticum]|uniref:nucleotidyltransferase family protein n=1 Tax=Sphingobacterium endophyticum TaxID=2546448 RepID=UPI0012E11560|nr:nucleotidyltransferase family protein [Sphingobacterium endophyticum]
MKDTGIILLAAGNSTRMGTAKQLLIYQGKTLLDRMINTALEVFYKNQIILVLGANHHEIASMITEKNISISINNDWQSGMASSIKSGLKTLIDRFPEMEKCFILVCDQPYLTSDLFLEMLKLNESSKKEIIVAKYADILGVPALFSKKYFENLLSLTGEQGAKKIIQQNMKDVETFEFEKGAIDIDTKADYENLKSKE